MFGNLEKCFHSSQTAKAFSSFTVISLVDAREGSFPFRSRFEKVLKFCPLAEKRGSLEGVRERGFKGLRLELENHCRTSNTVSFQIPPKQSNENSELPSRFFQNSRMKTVSF
jgi:hypothetical protein